MKNKILKIEHLFHKYNSSWAIHDVNLEINQTGIVGLLGSNGAGKSTTMNILCGVLNPTEGRVNINGIDLLKNPEDAKKNIGFLPQTAPLYLDFTVDEYLTYCAHLRLMKGNTIKDALHLTKEKCGISHFSNRLIGNLSGGYRQRVGIAQAIIHQPQLVILDEPTNGLDPNQVIEVRGLIREIAAERAVIFSSHILSEVQVLCDEITMIEGGKIVFSGTMDAFNNYVEPQSILLHAETPPTEATLLKIKGITKVEYVTKKQLRLHFKGDTRITGDVIKASVQDGWDLREISLEKTSLDEVFAQLSNHKFKNNV